MTTDRDVQAVRRYVALGALLAVLIVAALFLVACGDGQDDVALPTYGPAAATGTVPEPPPYADYVGPGAFRIGPEITPGTWITPGAATALCSYWLREDGQDGTVVESGSAGPGERLLVRFGRDTPADVFESAGCQPWREVSP